MKTLFRRNEKLHEALMHFLDSTTAKMLLEYQLVEPEVTIAAIARMRDFEERFR